VPGRLVAKRSGALGPVVFDAAVHDSGVSVSSASRTHPLTPPLQGGERYADSSRSGFSI
jgi:hypothetical protein